MTRFVSIGSDIYDLEDGSLHARPIGEWNGKMIYSAEALLLRFEGLTSPTVVFPIEQGDKIYKGARWFD